MPAYIEMAGRPWRETLSVCTWATLGDVVFTLAVYGVGALAAAQVQWGMTGKWNVYVTGALLGGAIAVVFEWIALASGRWSYTKGMPLVPIANVGLWPFLQLIVLVPGALAIAFWLSKRR